MPKKQPELKQPHVPAASKETQGDLAKMGKVAQRVQKTLADFAAWKEPKQLDPASILVAPGNRDGAPPNGPHIHSGILKGLMDNGFDSTRPQVGVCVEFRSAEGKRKLLEHNHRFSASNPQLPFIDESKVLYGSLASSHLNLALRLIQQGAASPVGDLRGLCEKDRVLADTVQNGHKWLVLQEDTPLEAQVDISLWRNQDQNENNGTHEIELLQNVVASAEQLKASRSSDGQRSIVAMSDLVAKSMRRTPAKISVWTMSTLCKFFVQFLESGDQSVLQELQDFHAARVNPKSLSVPFSFFHSLTTEQNLSNAPYLRFYLLLSNYTEEKTKAVASGPAQAGFIDNTSLTSLVKKPDLIKAIEAILRDIRATLLEPLQAITGPAQARLDLAVLADLLVRCLLAKQWPEAFWAHSARLKTLMHQAGVGKFSVEKVNNLKRIWALWVEEQYPGKDFANGVGLALEKPPEEKKEQPQELTVDLGVLGSTGATPPESNPDEGLKFKRGDEVIVIRRMTWVIRPSGVRMDVKQGTEATVEGFADAENRKLLIKVLMTLEGEGAPREVVHEACSRNLELRSAQKKSIEGLLHTGGTHEEAASSGGKKRGPNWILQGSPPEQVREEKLWTKLLSDQDNLLQHFWLRSRVGLCLESLASVMPQYTEKDLVVCHRQNSKGAWKCELWTKRDFGTRELAFAPLSSQIKETHLTLAANCQIGVPVHGEGASPNGRCLAIDGRTRASLASKDLLDPSEHTGSLFWIVERTSERSHANMVLEQISWEHKVTLNLPLKKAKHTVEKEAKDLPCLSVLVNLKAVKAHERLVVFQDVAPKEAQEQAHLGRKKSNVAKSSESL